MKKICSVIITFAILLVFLTGCSATEPYDDGDIKKRIFDYVNDNSETLLCFPYDKMELIYHGAYNIINAEERFVKKYFGKNGIVKQVYYNSSGILEFSCGGEGLSIGSTSVGFFYSENNTPNGLGFNYAGYTETSPGVYFYEDTDYARKNITVERIRENWFYYLEIDY